MTRVVNLRAEAYDVYIGRAGQGQDGYFGNPIRLVGYHNPDGRIRALTQYKEYFNKRVNTDVEFANRVLALRGKRLGCFCKPMPCHGDVIAAWLENTKCDGQCERQPTMAVSDQEAEDTAYRDPVQVVLLCGECAA